jgi:hypothetical protein
MNNLKAMYRRRNILARTISAFFARAFFWKAFVTRLGNKFAIGVALITWTYLRN